MREIQPSLLRSFKIQLERISLLLREQEDIMPSLDKIHFGDGVMAIDYVYDCGYSVYF